MPLSGEAPGVSGDSLSVAPGGAVSAGTGVMSVMPAADGRTVAMQERVVAGVLFSISNGILGEIFPVYLGRNLIGTGSDCDIRLNEATVSAEHAVLFARGDNYPDEVPMTLTDYGSMYGTSVNDNDCRYESLMLRDGDVLSVGRHYKLLLKTFDVGRAGLSEDPEFERMSGASPAGEAYAAGGSSNDGGYGNDANGGMTGGGNDFYAPSGDAGSRTVIG